MADKTDIAFLGQCIRDAVHEHCVTWRQIVILDNATRLAELSDPVNQPKKAWDEVHQAFVTLCNTIRIQEKMDG